VGSSRTNRIATGAAALVAVGLLCAATGATATAKDLALAGARGGVALAGSPHRYVALHPNRPGAPTVVARIERDGGRIDRWWYLPGDFHVPAVAADGSAGGLSGDGGTLVLTRFNRVYPPTRSTFALLDTELHLRHPLRAGQRRPVVRRITLPGYLNFHAISPDGETVYVNRHVVGGDRTRGDWELYALDVATGELARLPVGGGAGATRSGPGGARIAGLPVARLASHDGRWACTLYVEERAGAMPFVVALETVSGRAARIGAPELLAGLLRTTLAGSVGED
jgi:hypothetical protein